MLAKNCTSEQLEQALEQINQKYDSNVIFKRIPERVGRKIRFTLTVLHSKGKGGRLGQQVNSNGNHKHIAAACWHVHGDFFDALFSVAPDAVILSNGKPITRACGNWEDRNIGSMMYPFYYSEACDCGRED